MDSFGKGALCRRSVSARLRYFGGLHCRRCTTHRILGRMARLGRLLLCRYERVDRWIWRSILLNFKHLVWRDQDFLLFEDIMPTNDHYILVIMVIILIGLIVTTTCVDIVGAYYINQLHFFGRRLDIEVFNWR